MNITTNNKAFGQPALYGGLLMGVLSALPIISAGNICCCLWVICGGVLAAYLLQQNQAGPITPGDGALVGLLAGLIGAFVQLLVSLPISFLIGPFEREMMQRVFEMAGNVPPEVRDAFENSRGGAAWLILGRIFTLFFMLAAGAIFSTIGGLIGAAIFKKNTPPGTIDVVPTSP